MMSDRPEWMPTNPYLKRLQRKYKEFIGDRTDLMDFEQWLDTQNTQGMEGFNWGCVETARKLLEWGEKPCTRHIVPSVGGRHPARRFDCPYCMLQLKQEVERAHHA